MPHHGYPERAEYQASLIEPTSTVAERVFTFVRKVTLDPVLGTTEYEFIGNTLPTYGPATEAATVSGEAALTQEHESALFAGAVALGRYHRNVDPEDYLYATDIAKLAS
jgi:hypothetical protein